MLASLAAMGLILTQEAPPRPAPPRPVAAAERVWLIPGSVSPPRQPDGNTVIFLGEQGLVVVDTGRHPWHREAILNFARVQGRPIVRVVNTHWHLDHISGNAALKAAYPGLRVIASGALEGAIDGFLRPSAEQGRAYLDSGQAPPALAEDIRGDLASIAAIQTLAPDTVATGDHMLGDGGVAVRMHVAAHAATEGDIWLHDPISGTVVAGDLATLPAPFMDTACPDGWLAALDAIATTGFERLIPGHGPIMSRADFDRYRAAFDAFVDCGRSDRAAEDCATAWTGDVRPLLDDDAQAGLATRMAAYYVTAILRSDAARARFCAAPE